jgi:hypothetical protein
LVRNNGRRGASAFGVLDHFGRVAFHDGHARVGGAQVNTDDSSHEDAPKKLEIQMICKWGGVENFQVPALQKW